MHGIVWRSACGRAAVIGRDQSGRRRRGQCQSSNTFQQIGVRLRRSSRTSSRTSEGSLSRCDSRSGSVAASVSPATQSAGGPNRVGRSTQIVGCRCASATACPAARAANFAGSDHPRAGAFAAKAAPRASAMRTWPRTHARPTSMASRGRVSRDCSLSKRCSTCSGHGAAPPLAAGDARRSAFRPRRTVISQGSRSAGRIGMNLILSASRGDPHAKPSSTVTPLDR